MLQKRLTLMFDYAKDLNEYLSHSLQSVRSMENTAQHTENDITEILLLHRGFEHGLQPLGAVFVRKSGGTIGASMPSHKTYSGDKMTLIRHRLDRNEMWAPQRQTLIHKVPNVVRVIKSALWFREQADRYSQVKESHKRTFHWLLTRSEPDPSSPFRSWPESDAKCFRVSGKASSGKSTLMRFLCDLQSLLQILRLGQEADT